MNKIIWDDCSYRGPTHFAKTRISRDYEKSEAQNFFRNEHFTRKYFLVYFRIFLCQSIIFIIYNWIWLI